MKLHQIIANKLDVKSKLNPYQTVIQKVLKVKKDETVLIIANPATSEIAQSFFTAANEVKAKPSLIFQNDKTSFDYAEETVLAAIGTNPDVAISISNIKLGKDPKAAVNPYKTEDGQEFSHIFDYLLDGKKTMRAVWTPGITIDMMERTAAIDYDNLQSCCKKLSGLFKNAEFVHVTAPAGTDIIVPVKGRNLLSDDGDFSKPGSGGNIPAGEVFISPLVPDTDAMKSAYPSVKSDDKGNGVDNAKGDEKSVGEANTKAETLSVANDANSAISANSTEAKLSGGGANDAKPNPAIVSNDSNGCEGVIVFDGSMTFSDGDSILEKPIRCTVEKGFVKEIKGGSEAARLLKTITEAENRSISYEKEGKLPKGQGKVYKRNARNIGELGIGLNPAARITGNMLEDEKAFRTCHFAIGENYDNDAPSLIHLDGVVKNPTIVIKYIDGSERMILKEGDLQV